MRCGCSKRYGREAGDGVMRAWLCALIAALLPAAPLAGQGYLVGAELRAALEHDPGQAEVRIRYRLRPDSAGAEVRLAALPVAGVQLVEVSADVGGAGRSPLLLTRRVDGPAAGRLEGHIRLPAGTPAGSEVSLDLYYRVIAPTTGSPVSRRIELPVLAVLWVPERAVPGVFRGTVSVHPGLEIGAAFPADLGRDPGRIREDGGHEYAFDLPVAPALLAFTLRTGSAFPFLEAFLDLTAALAILLFGWAGWRRFRVEM